MPSKISNPIFEEKENDMKNSPYADLSKLGV